MWNDRINKRINKDNTLKIFFWFNSIFFEQGIKKIMTLIIFNKIFHDPTKISRKKIW